MENAVSGIYTLQMTSISKKFPGVQALDNMNLRVRRGTLHSLIGENGAGKSTLMKCLFGIYSPDSGEIVLEDETVSFANPSEALLKHVSMVHQELNQVPRQTVMENMWLGRYPLKMGFVDDKKMYQDTLEIFKRLNINIDPRSEVGTLSVSQKQMIEIAKAVSYDAKIIVMDEPTSSLTDKEVDHLFEIIKKLKANNTSIIYISHKMEEIFKISEDVTVMRDGKWITTKSITEITIDEIIKLMVGRDLTERYPKKTVAPGKVLLEVKNFASSEFNDVDFELHENEILGIAGLVGAKRTEVLETLFGMRQKKEGKIILEGKEIDNNSPLNAMKNGFAMVTEERRHDGAFLNLSVSFNLIISNIKSYVKSFFLNDKLISKDVNEMISAMNVKTPKGQTPIGNLSGGNQQKVIFGRWLLTKPKVLLLDEPTRGIDIGAKYEIYQLINRLAAENRGVIIVSSEMPELFGICDRIITMSNGRQSGIFDAKNVSQVEIMEAAVKYL
ncbi:MAG: ATP-binding cassette domain-containing protein [Defluviitaleaceae bacterium]|nr:ATP-binding cassette domain-containing protein [Defluviitaleaceae bacterium]